MTVTVPETYTETKSFLKCIISVLIQFQYALTEDAQLRKLYHIKVQYTLQNYKLYVCVKKTTDFRIHFF